MWLISMAEGDVEWLKRLCLTSKLDILRQPRLVFLKKHVLAPTNRLGSCTKTAVERDKIESDFFQMISLCHEIDPKTTRRHQKNTSHRLFVDGNRPRFSCHKPRKCCPYRRNALKHKKEARWPPLSSVLTQR